MQALREPRALYPPHLFNVLGQIPKLSGRNLTGTMFVYSESLVLLLMLPQRYIFYLSSVNWSGFSLLRHAKDRATLPMQPCLLNLVRFSKGVKGKSSFIGNCARVSNNIPTDGSSSKEERTTVFPELGSSRGVLHILMPLSH